MENQNKPQDMKARKYEGFSAGDLADYLASVPRHYRVHVYDDIDPVPVNMVEKSFSVGDTEGTILLISLYGEGFSESESESES